MKKIGLLTVSVALALTTAGHARADSQDFVDYIASRGEVTEGMEYEVIDLGQAICSMFEAGGTVDEVWDTLNQRDNAVWIVGSINYLCPDYRYLLN